MSACVRWYVRVNQCVAPPCIDRKRGPNSRLLLNLIPGRPFTMFSISLYDDIRTKEASQKRICALKREGWIGYSVVVCVCGGICERGICELIVPIKHLLRPLVCGYPRGTGKGF